MADASVKVIRVEVPGPQGPAGAGFIGRGPYDAGKSYIASSVVSYLGSSFAAKMAVPQLTPPVVVDGIPQESDYWSIVAAGADPGFVSDQIDAAKGLVDQTANYAAAATAMLGGKIFASTAAGIAGVADGAPFLVQGGSGADAFGQLYRRSGSAATDQGLAIPSLVAVTNIVRSFTPEVLDVTATGIQFLARDPEKVYLYKVMGEWRFADGALLTNKLEFIDNNQPTGTRWNFVMLSKPDSNGNQHVVFGIDKAGEGRLLLDAISRKHLEDNLSVGGIDPADLPPIGGVKALVGVRGTTFNTLWSDVYGAGGIFRQSVTTQAISLVSSHFTWGMAGGGQSNEQASTNPVDDSAHLTTTAEQPECLFTFNDSFRLHGPGNNVVVYGSTPGLRNMDEFKQGDLEDTGYAHASAWFQRQRLALGLGPVPILARQHAIAGQDIDVIKPGGTGPAWQNGLTQAREGVRLCALEGLPDYRQIAEFMWHGEASRSSNKSEATYMDFAADYVTKMQTERKVLIPGQTDNIKLIMYQLAASATAGASQIATAQLKAMLANADVTMIATHIFQRVDATSLHFLNMARKHAREYGFKYLLDWMTTGVKPVHLYTGTPVYSGAGGHHVDIPVLGNVRKGNLRVFNTSNGGWLNPHPTRGFAHGSDAGEQVTSVDIVDNDTIRLWLTAQPTTNKWYSVAYNEGGANAASGYPKSYCDIFDEDPRPSEAFPDRGVPNTLASNYVSYR